MRIILKIVVQVRMRVGKVHSWAWFQLALPLDIGLLKIAYVGSNKVASSVWNSNQWMTATCVFSKFILSFFEFFLEILG